MSVAEMSKINHSTLIFTDWEMKVQESEVTWLGRHSGLWQVRLYPSYPKPSAGVNQ